MSDLDRQGALAVRQYVAARNRYRQFSRRTRPPEVADAYESAKRRLRKVGGEPNCPSPHLNTGRAGCSSCPSQCYRKGTYLL